MTLWGMTTCHGNLQNSPSLLRLLHVWDILCAAQRSSHSHIFTNFQPHHCGCRRIWGQFQHSNECNLPHLIATDLSPQINQSFTLLLYHSLWHTGWPPWTFSCIILVGMFWLAETASDDGQPRPLHEQHLPRIRLRTDSGDRHAETARVQSLGHFTLYLNTVHKHRGIAPLVLTCHCWAKLAHWKWTT